MAAGMGIVWGGVHEMQDGIDKIIVKVDAAAREAVTLGGHLIERRASQKVHVITGTLRRSIHVDAVTKLGVGRWQSITGPSEIYARQVEFGGTIVPVNASILAWVTSGARPTDSAGWAAARKAGIAIYAKSVTTLPHPYMKPAFDESIGAVHEIYRLAFEEVWRV